MSSWSSLWSSCVGRVVVGVAEQFNESLDSCVPEALVAAQPIIGTRERTRVDATVVDAPAHGALYEPGSFERLDVLRGRGERNAVRRSKLADSVLSGSQSLEHCS